MKADLAAPNAGPSQSAEATWMVTAAGGTGAKWLPDYTETLSDTEVILVPDTDSPGWKHAETIAREIVKVNIFRHREFLYKLILLVDRLDTQLNRRGRFQVWKCLSFENDLS